jgi:hypothetical protein
MVFEPVIFSSVASNVNDYAKAPAKLQRFKSENRKVSNFCLYFFFRLKKDFTTGSLTRYFRVKQILLSVLFHKNLMSWRFLNFTVTEDLNCDLKKGKRIDRVLEILFQDWVL